MPGNRGLVFSPFHGCVTHHSAGGGPSWFSRDPPGGVLGGRFLIHALLHSLIVYSIVYGLMNAYCFWRLSVFIRRRGTRIALGLVAAILACGGAVEIAFDWLEWTRTERAMRLAAYCWLAAVLWFSLLGGCVEAWNLGLRALARRRPGVRRWMAPTRPAVMAVCALTGVMLAYGAVEARSLRVEEFRIRSPHFRGAPLRILQISDVHLGLIEGERRTRQIIEAIERTRPDLLICTGDLLDGSGEHLRRPHEAFANIKPRLGKIAVLGNHEYYYGIRNSLALHEAAGFRVLRGEAVELDGGRLRLAGLDDPTGMRLGLVEREADAAALLGPPRGDRFTMLLKHRPLPERGAAGKFDLMLSGHTHAGQILPFGLVAWLEYPFFAGVHQLPGGGVLRISRGTGTWGPPMRVGAPPEATLIMLEEAR